nr:unnamed protein product [Callosobruchus analis]
MTRKHDIQNYSNKLPQVPITGHFIDETFKMRSILLECDIFEGTHTGLNLSKTLIEVAKNWGLEKKVILAVSDNAANIKNAIAYTGWKHFGCFAHSLNLTVQGALKVVHAILEKIKIIVAYFKRSSKATKILIDIQKKNDPRFKYFGFKNKDAVENVKKDVLNALTETITAENKEDPRHHESEPGSSRSVIEESPVPAPVFPNKEGYSLWDSLDKCVSKFKPYLTSNSMAVTELQRYLGDGVLSRNKNPLDWWRENQYNYPYLSRLVRSKCCALAITGHFIDETFKMRSILLECDIFEGTHTGLNLSKTLIEVAKNWGLEKKVILAVSDNAANIKNAIAYTGWKHFGCFAHSLNLTVQGALKVVHAILEKIKIIVAYFKRSSKATKILIDIQKKNDPRFKYFGFKNKDAVENVKKDVLNALTETITAENKEDPRHHESEPGSSRSVIEESPVPAPVFPNKEGYSLWDSLDKCVSKFKPYLTSNSMAVTELQRYLGDGVLSRNKNPLDWWRENQYNYPYLSRLVRSKCCALDPRFKYFGFKNKDAVENVKKDVLNALTETITAENKEDPRHHESEPGSSRSVIEESPVPAPVFPNKEGYSLWIH